MAEKKKRKRSTGKLDRVHTHAAGVDVGSTFHVAAVSGKIAESPVQAFKSFTADLHAMADWLSSHGVKTVAMESTGVYCKESPQTIVAALSGNYRREHIFALRQAVDFYDFHQTKIRECDGEIEALLEALNATRPVPADALPPVRHARPRNEPKFAIRELLHVMLGADLSQIHGLGPYTILRLVAECGDDMTKCLMSDQGLRGRPIRITENPAPVGGTG